MDMWCGAGTHDDSGAVATPLGEALRGEECVADGLIAHLEDQTLLGV